MIAEYFCEMFDTLAREAEYLAHRISKFLKSLQYSLVIRYVLKRLVSMAAAEFKVVILNGTDRALRSITNICKKFR
jgi:hypothetical protein